ncbi:MAG: thioredoxin family protein, partial [Planctomycetaceae bacterium]|nr:thioredoxin family protein [Planctomycetaceae bacterium]
MRRRCFLSLLMVAMAGTPSLAAAANTPPPVRGWHHNVADAVRDVEQLDVPLVMHFHASWCGPCKRMDREVLSSSALRDHLGRRLVGVKVDADQHPELLEKFGVGSLPTDLILDPNGKVLARMKGYQEPREYLGRLARAEANYASERKVRIARQRSSEPTELHLSRRNTPSSVDKLHPGEDRESAANNKPPGDGSLNLHEGMLVGLGGY